MTGQIHRFRPPTGPRNGKRSALLKAMGFALLGAKDINRPASPDLTAFILSSETLQYYVLTALLDYNVLNSRRLTQPENLSLANLLFPIWRTSPWNVTYRDQN